MFWTFQGELEHRRGKRCYKRVHKGKYIVGIGKQVRRERYFHRTQALRKAQAKRSSIEDTLPTMPFHVEERLPPTSPEQHHHISLDNRHKIILPIWLNRHKSDPALYVS
jgi:hypothetical protein